MLDHEETLALCGLATEFANAARLYRRAADADGGDGREALRRSGDIRQEIADGLVARFAPEALPADGSWLPSSEEVEFRLKSAVSQGWGAAVLVEADRQLFARIHDLLTYAGPSDGASRVIREARAALSVDAEAPQPPRQPTEQPG